MGNVRSTQLSPQVPGFPRVRFSILHFNSSAPVNFSMSAYLPTGKKQGQQLSFIAKHLKGFGLYRSALDKGKDYCFHLTALTKSVLMVRLCFIVGQACAERPEAFIGQQL